MTASVRFTMGQEVIYRRDAYEPPGQQAIGTVLRANAKLEWPSGWESEPHGPSKDVIGVHWTRGRYTGEKEPVDRSYILPTAYLQDARRRMLAFVQAGEAIHTSDPLMLDRLPVVTAVWDFLGLVWQKLDAGWRSPDSTIVSHSWPAARLIDISGAVRMIGPSLFWPS
ncbi:hypothetical protein [Nocardia sp. NPDC051570]|uniref:hypothetical protein n=1 Tax=Nocardia sp. NPDC051570 TaxID=3364324 RepID=UPI003789D7BD